MKNRKYHIIASLLWAVVVLTLGWTIRTFQEVSERETDPDTGARLTPYDCDELLDELEYLGYSSFVDNVYENKVLIEEPDEEMLECYALADYYVAALRYQAYAQNGMAEKAEAQKEIMDESAAQLGDLVSYKEELDEKLGIEE